MRGIEENQGSTACNKPVETTTNRIIHLIVRHTFTPHNNTRLSHLCGPMDAHLRTIEAGLQVSIAHRHEQFKVDGPKAVALRAMEILQAIYERADRPIAPDMVQLMLVGDSGGEEADLPALQTRRADLKARTPVQAAYLESIATHDISFGIGPAGTGKTYLAVACAVDALERASVQRIVLTRPAVEAGERLGFLPGDLSQKVDPYLRPLYDALYDLMGYDKVQKAFERNAIEIAPLAFMRGRTLNNAFVILDEAQNTSTEQMKMFLTRIGFGAKAVVTGDVSQIDLPKGQLSGLIDAEWVLKRVKGIAFTGSNETAWAIQRSLADRRRVIQAARRVPDRELSRLLRPPILEGHDIRIGADYRRADGELQEEALNAVSGAITERRRAGGATSNLGLFIEDDWQFGPLLLNGGLRADRTSITDGFYRAVSASGVPVRSLKAGNSMPVRLAAMKSARKAISTDSIMN